MRRGGWWWTAVLIMTPVVLASTLSVVLLLALVDAASASDQIELIKTGLAVGAGTGGAVALVLAGRRQWSTERAYQVTARSAEDTRHDAGERRITDLYSKSADQLGSDKAAVRLAGVYSLERLAQATPQLRQTIVSLMCAYLRMPFRMRPGQLDTRYGSEELSEEAQRTLQELEVRLTAQRILAAHLRPGPDPDRPLSTFWAGMDLDLSGAVLHQFDIKGAWVRDAAFGGASFIGRTRFRGVRFDGDVVFGGARFEQSANFNAARFAQLARFRGATFGGVACFDDVVFAGDAMFGGVRALGDAMVADGAEFAEGATFNSTSFAQPPNFEHVRSRAQLVGLPDSVELD